MNKTKYKHEIIWHYSKCMHLEKIMNHGFLLPCQSYNDEKTILWFSAEEYWENSINSGVISSEDEIPWNVLDEEMGVDETGQIRTIQTVSLNLENMNTSEVRAKFVSREESVKAWGGAVRFGVYLPNNIKGRPTIFPWKRLWRKAGIKPKLARDMETPSEDNPYDTSKWYGCLKPIRLDYIDYVHMMTTEGEWADIGWDEVKSNFIDYVNRTINGIGKGRFDPYPEDFSPEMIRQMTPGMIANCYRDPYPDDELDE